MGCVNLCSDAFVEVLTMRTFKVALAVILVVVGLVIPAERREERQGPERWEETIAGFEKWDSKNAWPDKPILFYSSSSIVMWKTREFFPDLPVMNRGFGGSQMSDALYYVDRMVIPYRPQVIVLYEGDNDIASRERAEQVFEEYKQFVAKVHKALPQTAIVFVTIKASGSRWRLWPEMHKANEMIREFAEGDERLYFADCASVLLKDGKPDDSFFLEDRLHLKPKGYEKWTAVVRPIIDEVMSKASADE
jgi:lysophospholipase L1-like esterase